jgi:hypothetical protein
MTRPEAEYKRRTAVVQAPRRQAHAALDSMRLIFEQPVSARMNDQPKLLIEIVSDIV